MGTRGAWCKGYLSIFVVSILMFLMLPASQAWALDVEREYVVGVPENFPPEYLLGSKREPEGFAIDFMNEIARRSGLRIKYQVFPNFADVIKAMRNGEIDIIPNIGITDERKVYMDFSVPVETSDIHIFERATANRVKNISDLKGLKVAVVNENRGKAIMENLGGSELFVYQSAEEALMSLFSGATDALVFPEQQLLYIARQLGIEKRVRIAGETLEELKRSIGVRKGESLLLSRLDTAIVSYITTPEFQKIYIKWYSEPNAYWSTGRVLMYIGIALALGAVVFFVLYFFILFRLNRKLRESEGILQTVVQTSPLAIIVFNQQGVVSMWNKAAESVFGWKADEVIGKPNPIIPPEKSDEVRRVRQQIENGKVYVGFETECWRKDGTRIIVSFSAVKLPVQKDGKAQFLTVISDITEMKRESEMVRARLRLLYFSFTHSADELLRRTLDELEKMTSSQIGFFHFLEADQRTLTLQMWSTRTENMFCRAEAKGMSYELSKAGVWADCVRERRHIIHNDYASLPNKKGMPSGHARVIREVVVPVFRNSKIVAILGMGNKSSDYTDRDAEAISRFADLAWDMVEKKRAEDALSESEEKYRSLVERSNDGVLFIQDELVKFVNTRLAQLWKGKPEEMIGTSLIEHIHPDKRGEVVERYRRRMAGEDTPPIYETVLLRKDGSPIQVEINAGVSSFRGKPADFIIVRDITERKTAENEILRLKEQDEAILHSMGDGVMACDKEGRILVFNKMAEKMTGVSNKEALSLHYREVLSIVDEVSGKPVDDFIAKAIDINKVISMRKNVLLIRKNGDKLPIADSAAPIRDTTGTPAGCVMVFRDVTEERSIDRAKTELISLASHQMRTPLTAIGWYTQLLQSKERGELSKDQSKFTEEIIKANSKMVALVGSLLNVSRLEMGTFSIVPEPIDIVALANRNIELFESEIGLKSLKVQKKFDTGIGTFMADPSLLGIVFQNLLSNAIKYTPAGGSIDFGIAKEADLIKIAVSDTGMGIPKYQQNKIFTKLFRGDNAYKVDPSGTGLGLYIVKEIVDHSGGKIWFESEEGKGTTFCATFPLTGMIAKAGDKRIT